MTKKEVGRQIQCHAVKQITHVNGLSRRWQLGHQLVAPALEYLHVSDPVFDKHGSDQSATVMPLSSIGCKYAVTEEWRPGIMELLALSKMCEFTRQDSLDMFGLLRKNDAAAEKEDFDSIGRLRRGGFENLLEKVVQAVLVLIMHRSKSSIESCRGFNAM